MVPQSERASVLAWVRLLAVALALEWAHAWAMGLVCMLARGLVVVSEHA